jgi:hypothetical protein
MNPTPLEVGMLLYPGFIMLDLVGPMTALQMHSRIRLLCKDLQPVMSDTTRRDGSDHYARRLPSEIGRAVRSRRIRDCGGRA